MSVRADQKQIEQFRRNAVRSKGIDLVIGHHPHVVRGVELNSGKLIFYGLGNFLHHGLADMNRYGLCRDYGLLARIHLSEDQSGNLKARAIEAIPLKNMHIRPERFKNLEHARKRIHALNYLATFLDNASENAKGIRFTPQDNGNGLYCAEGAGEDKGKIGALCKGWAPAPPIPRPVLQLVRRSCSAYSSRYRKPGNWTWSRSKSQRKKRGRRRAPSEPSWTWW